MQILLTFDTDEHQYKFTMEGPDGFIYGLDGDEYPSIIIPQKLTPKENSNLSSMVGKLFSLELTKESPLFEKIFSQLGLSYKEIQNVISLITNTPVPEVPLPVETITPTPVVEEPSIPSLPTTPPVCDSIVTYTHVQLNKDMGKHTRTIKNQYLKTDDGLYISKQEAAQLILNNYNKTLTQ